MYYFFLLSCLRHVFSSLIPSLIHERVLLLFSEFCLSRTSFFMFHLWHVSTVCSAVSCSTHYFSSWFLQYMFCMIHDHRGTGSKVICGPENSYWTHEHMSVINLLVHCAVFWSCVHLSWHTLTIGIMQLLSYFLFIIRSSWR